MPTPVPSGSEFRVNSYTPDRQQVPVTTALPGGGFVVVWESRFQDGSEYGVYGQRYDAAGAPVGGEFRVNSTTAGTQYHPSIDTLQDGGFVVTWISAVDGTGTFSVLGQRYDASGAPRGGEFQVAAGEGASFRPTVVGLPDGGFVVGWEEGRDLHAQRFSSAGTPLGEFTLNAQTVGLQDTVDLAPLPGGGFVATWMTYSETGPGREVFGRVFDAAGAPLTGDFRVNTTAFAGAPSVTAIGDNGFVVTWSGETGVMAQRFNTAGSPLGAEFRLSSSATGVSPSATSLPDGGFLVTWVTNGQDGSEFGVFGRQFAADGSPVGDEFRVNATTQGAQLEPSVDTLAGGDAIVAWTSYSPDASGSIHAQRFDVTAAPGGDGGGGPVASRFAISAPAPQAEGNGGTTPFVFTVTRNADATGAAAVDWFVPVWVQPGPNPSDFSGGTSGTVYFAEGESSKTIQLNVLGDTAREPDETLTVQLSNPRGGAISIDRASTTIVNDDGDTPPVAMLTWGTSTAGVTLQEGDSGSTTFTYVVNRSGDTSGTTTVDWRVSPASASNDDFAGPLTGTLVFAPGELSKEINVLVAGDTTPENDESFQVNLTNAPGATFPGENRPGRIVNDDGIAAGPTFAISGPAPQPEGTGSNTVFEFTVTRSGDTSTFGIVDYFTVGDTDAADFTGKTTGSVYFAAGETTKTVRLEAIGDATREGDESFFVGLSNPRGGTITTGRANTAILNDDADTPPGATLSWGTDPAGLSRNEGDSGATAFTYTVNRSGDLSGTTSANWSVVFNQTAADDFSGATSGTIVFAPGEQSKSFTVNVAGDIAPESDETFFVQLGDSPGATLPPRISGKIVNDDTGAPGAATLSISGPGARAEGTGANTIFDFVVTRSGDTSGLTMADYYLIGDTNAADFTGPTTGTVYFQPGATSVVIHIEAVGDATPEPDEGFTVGLSNVRGGVIGVGQAPGRILDDDGWLGG